MKERKNLDRLFQEKFKDFEMNPPEQSWKNIEAALQKQRKRRPIPIWWFQAAGVAAVLLIGLFAWNNFYDTPSTESIPSAPSGTTRNPDNSVVSAPENGSPAGPSQSLRPETPTQGEEEKNGGKNVVNPAAPKSREAVATSESANPENLQQDRSDVKTGTSAYRKGSKQNLVIPESGKGRNASETRIATAVGKRSDSKSGNVAAKRNDVIAQRKKAIDTKTASEKANPSTTNEGVAVSKTSGKTGSEDAISVQNPPDLKSGIASQNEELKKSDALASTSIDSAKIADDTKKLQDLLQPKNEKEEVIADAPVGDRWQVSTNVAPVYLGSASKTGSPIDPQFASNGKSYENSTSYGVGVNYAVNKRLSVRAGVNKLNMAYNTNDVVFFASLGSTGLQGLAPNPTGSFIQVMNQSAAADGLENFELAIRDENIGALKQEMGYLEVPVELSYKLLDRKFSISVIGGFSTLFLDENRLSLLSPGMSARIGEAKNLNSIHYSSNFGIGLRYRFLKSLEFHCEPTLKYQMNTFSGNDGNFKPYVIGLYSGLSFSF